MAVVKTDRELLELAAKAAGYELDGLASNYIAQGVGPDDWIVINERGGHSVWNPLANDGDALRLAVKLGIYVGTRTAEVWRDGKEIVNIFDDDGDDEQGTRRAIVRAAAEIGE